MKNRKTIAIIAAAVVIPTVLVLGVLAVAKWRGDREPAAAPDPIDAGDVMGVYMQYYDNAAAGDSAFTGKTVRVTGSVRSVQNHGNGYDMDFLPLAGEGSPVLAVFPSSAASEVAKIKHGDKVAVVGTCEGIAPSKIGYMGRLVIVRNCRIVPQ